MTFNNISLFQIMCKIGLHVELRAQFILESVADLRSNLQQRGLDLIVRQGKPEDIVPAIAKATGAHTVISLSPLQTSRMNVSVVNCGFLGYCFSQL
jgi:deoxyribodipyrimidine photolyase